MADRTLSAAIYIADIADTRGRPLTAIGALTGHNRTDEHHKAGTRFFSSPSPLSPLPLYRIDPSVRPWCGFKCADSRVNAPIRSCLSLSSPLDYIGDRLHVLVLSDEASPLKARRVV